MSLAPWWNATPAVAFLIALLAAGSGAARGEATPPSVDRILEFFHTEDVLADAGPRFVAALAKRKKEGGVSETQQRLIESLGKRIYPPKNLLKIFKLAYTKAVTLETMNGLYAWMNTPRGIQLRQGIAGAYKVKAKVRDEYFTANSQELLKQNRKNAIRTFLAEWQYDQFYAVFQGGLLYGLTLGLTGFQPAEARETPARTKERTISRRLSFLEEGREAQLKLAFYTFKEVKNAEIDELTAFASTPLGQAHTRAYLKALEGTLDGAATTVLAQVLKDSK